MELLYDAAQVAYQAFFFDNSRDGEDASIMFAHFKRLGEEKRWDPINRKDVPTWFINYYSARIPRQ
jgi:hypothetical protein